MPVIKYNSISYAEYNTSFNECPPGLYVDVLNKTESFVEIVVGECIGTISAKIQESDDGINFTDYISFNSIDSSNDNTTYSETYSGLKRYIRAYATTTNDESCTFGIDIYLSVASNGTDPFITYYQSMPVSYKIAEIKAMYPKASQYSDSQLFTWIKKVEQICFADFARAYDTVYLSTTAGVNYIQDNIDMAGYNPWLYPTEVYHTITVNGETYTKIDERTDPRTLSVKSFWFTDENDSTNGLHLYPTPTTTGTNNIIIPVLFTRDSSDVYNEYSVLKIASSHNDAYDFYVISIINLYNNQPDWINWYDRFEARLKDFAKSVNKTAPYMLPQTIVSAY